jgi:hypothetical protein
MDIPPPQLIPALFTLIKFTQFLFLHKFVSDGSFLLIKYLIILYFILFIFISYDNSELHPEVIIGPYRRKYIL